MITVFMDSHTQFKKEFLLNEAFLRQELLRKGKAVEGFLLKVGREETSTMLISGGANSERQTGQEELEAFEDWLKAATEVTGKLEVPDL